MGPLCYGRHLERDRRGSSILELSILLPVFLSIALGVFEFGNLIYKYHLITVGVRDAGRYLSGLPCVSDATREANAKNIAATGVTSGGTNRVSWWNTGSISVAYSTVSNYDVDTGAKLYRGGDVIDIVTASTSVSYQSLSFLSYLGLSSITLNASHEERCIGIR